MGGPGSGRYWHWDAKSTTADYLHLDVRRLARDGLLEDGRRFDWHWTRNGERVGSINISVQSLSITLDYRSRQGGGEWEPLKYQVRLLSQPCNFGGERKWFACPAKGCGRRVAILYGGRIYACSHCYDLAYPSQREEPCYRHQRRANKIKERLGWEGDWGVRPKGMHHRTFERLTAELSAWEFAADSAFNARLLRRFGHLVDPMNL